MAKSEELKITSRTEDYSKWYLDAIEAADLAEHSIVRGCMVIKPNGYAIWENIQSALDKMIKETGHKNVYFPLFIPKSLLSKEAEHVKGFAKECAVVTHYRLKESPDGKGVIVDPEAKLEEELIVRPTSETIMYDTFSKWITSWRDLPILINQWANVVRWEMRTRFFLRTTEFLWQEGHTAHATHDEAVDEVLKMLNVYKKLNEDYLAIPVLTGYKSKSETFPGALRTHCIEALMQDGKALQAGTSHDLGDNFSKAQDIKYIDKEGNYQYVWQTSWGLSTRIMGALIMTHSDDKGLVLPPKIAPIKVVIVPIWKTEDEKEKVLNKSYDMKATLNKNEISVEVDERDYKSPGFKFNDWEKKGVPIRMEIGPKDIQEGQVVMVRRDTSEKIVVPTEKVVEKVQFLIKDIQENLYKKALEFREKNTHEAKTYEDFKKHAEEGGFIKAFWCEDENCELKIKEETKTTIRCLPYESKEEKGKCICCGKDAKHKWLFAQGY